MRRASTLTMSELEPSTQVLGLCGLRRARPPAHDAPKRGDRLRVAIRAGERASSVQSVCQLRGPGRARGAAQERLGLSVATLSVEFHARRVKPRPALRSRATLPSGDELVVGESVLTVATEVLCAREVLLASELGAPAQDLKSREGELHLGVSRSVHEEGVKLGARGVMLIGAREGVR
jgi:hypothetical protein